MIVRANLVVCSGAGTSACTLTTCYTTIRRKTAVLMEAETKEYYLLVVATQKSDLIHIFSCNKPVFQVYFVAKCTLLIVDAITRHIKVGHVS